MPPAAAKDSPDAAIPAACDDSPVDCRVLIVDDQRGSPSIARGCSTKLVLSSKRAQAHIGQVSSTLRLEEISGYHRHDLVVLPFPLLPQGAGDG
jgi:hypothetical protein